MPIWGVLPIVCATSCGQLCCFAVPALSFFLRGGGQWAPLFSSPQKSAEMTSCRYTCVHMS
uniref:Hypothetical secreted protein 400 n=1 Tax=Amblyomma variegatum TaxID=34610 RepID=F0JA46_AMBVA|nr:TPA_inf: hypothetical secreted protein 400 [Amblyomma variegatum]